MVHELHNDPVQSLNRLWDFEEAQLNGFVSVDVAVSEPAQNVVSDISCST